MRVYFLSGTPAVLKLNGEYSGTVDLFERYTEIDLKDNILAEIVPGDNLQPVNFFLNEKILSSPPEFLDVYLSGEEIILFVRRFESRSARIKVIFQTRFENNLITVFSQGDIYLSVEGAGFELIPLGTQFKEVRAERHMLASFPVLALWGGGTLTVISHTGTQIFANEVTYAEFGTTFKTGVQFETCTAAKADCEYAYDGEKLTLIKSRTAETQPADDEIMHFAFFESVLTCGDYEKYLSPELAPKAGDLKSYLGAFTGVRIPTAAFYAAHPEERAAGLIYPKGENLFEVKYFAVQIRDGKVDNIYPVE